MLLLIGGVANTEINGRVINSVRGVELLFPDGEYYHHLNPYIIHPQYAAGSRCYPESFTVPHGLGAGFAMSNRKDLIVNCFGFSSTLHLKGCLLWRKKNQMWEKPIFADIIG